MEPDAVWERFCKSDASQINMVDAVIRVGMPSSRLTRDEERDKIQRPPSIAGQVGLEKVSHLSAIRIYFYMALSANTRWDTLRAQHKTGRAVLLKPNPAVQRLHQVGDRHSGQCNETASMMRPSPRHFLHEETDFEGRT